VGGNGKPVAKGRDKDRGGLKVGLSEGTRGSESRVAMQKIDAGLHINLPLCNSEM